jgi:hypothetical protein
VSERLGAPGSDRRTRLLATDKLFLGYVVYAGLLALVAGGRTGALIAAVHAVVVAAVWGLSRLPVPANRVLRFLRIAYPVAIAPLFYAELATVNQFLFAGTFDEMVQGWETALFGVQLSVTASEWFPSVVLSEFLHLGYVSYYLLVPAGLIGAYLLGGSAGLERTVFAVALAFYVSYAIFAVFPVAGPRYDFDPIGGDIAQGTVYGVVHTILEAGSSKGTAFPSSHIAAAGAAVLAAGREDRRLFWWLLPALLALTLGTVYGRFHYGVDAAAGAALALAIWIATPRLVNSLGGMDRRVDLRT